MARPRKTATAAEAPAQETKRKYLSQSDVPRHTLEEALRVPRVIADQYGKRPASPLDVAAALQVQPTTGGFRSLTGAALAYELTDGGPNVTEIGLTELGLRIVAPTEEGDDLAAMREAVMKPRVVREFLEKYDGSKLPRADIGRNVLERMGVPAEATERTLALIVSNAHSLGLLTEIKDEQYVNLRGVQPPGPAEPEPEPEEDVDEEGAVAYGPAEEEAEEEPAPPPVTDVPATESLVKNRRVFISHGRNKEIVAQLKELLAYGDFEAVVSVERESTAKPVPEKVLGDMRSCGAGIIHVSTERVLTDADGKEHHVLNPNVLIEIGAAMALYGSNYILLVEEGTELPSNVRGLYEARYSGDALDHDATLKLLRTFKEFKSDDRNAG
jgi:hypothetical protein